jgi:hypothetical protein
MKKAQVNEYHKGCDVTVAAEAYFVNNSSAFGAIRSVETISSTQDT